MRHDYRRDHVEQNDEHQAGENRPHSRLVARFHVPLTKSACETERNPVVETAPERNWAHKRKNAKFAKYKAHAMTPLDWDRDLTDGNSFGEKRMLEGCDSIEEA